ncbi:hypothetical protein CASFOL_004272 [Castilleja foliolosa]|uniref:Uncharacterized protein n=1 Tax=Castilleja foliolosa TaxID=1961234 RepID=A0ABD3E9Y2_9LAMI
MLPASVGFFVSLQGHLSFHLTKPLQLFPLPFFSVTDISPSLLHSGFPSFFIRFVR